MVEATGDVDFDALQAQADNLAAKGNQQPGLVGLFNGFRARTPQLYVDIDRTKVKTMGVALTDVFDALQVVPGQLLRQRLQPLRPHLAGERPGRRRLPRGRGDRQAAQGPQRRRRHGAAGRGGRRPRLRRAGARSRATTCSRRRRSTAPRCRASAPATSSRRWNGWRTRSCRASMTYEWTELSYLQKQASKIEQFRDLQQNPFSAFVLGVVLVFFVLAGLYESWSLPLAVILVVPMCLLSALAGVALARHGRQHLRAGRLRRAGRPGVQERHPDRRVRPRPAAGGRVRCSTRRVEAARVRLRPIIMTSFAFILGVLPLVIAARGRGRDAAHAGHGRLRRHARRDAVRHLPDAGVLLRRPLVQRASESRRRAEWPARPGYGTVIHLVAVPDCVGIETGARCFEWTVTPLAHPDPFVKIFYPPFLLSNC